MLTTYVLLVLLTFVLGMLVESMMGGEPLAWESWIGPALLWPVFVVCVLWFLAVGRREGE